jgi:hypothetical protein
MADSFHSARLARLILALQITQIDADSSLDAEVPLLAAEQIGDLTIAANRWAAQHLRTLASVVAVLSTGRRARGASVPPRLFPM